MAHYKNFPTPLPATLKPTHPQILIAANLTRQTSEPVRHSPHLDGASIDFRNTCKTQHIGSITHTHTYTRAHTRGTSEGVACQTANAIRENSQIKPAAVEMIDAAPCFVSR